MEFKSDYDGYLARLEEKNEPQDEVIVDVPMYFNKNTIKTDASGEDKVKQADRFLKALEKCYPKKNTEFLRLLEEEKAQYHRPEEKEYWQKNFKDIPAEDNVRVLILYNECFPIYELIEAILDIYEASNLAEELFDKKVLRDD